MRYSKKAHELSIHKIHKKNCYKVKTPKKCTAKHCVQEIPFYLFEDFCNLPYYRSQWKWYFQLHSFRAVAPEKLRVSFHSFSLYLDYLCLHYSLGVSACIHACTALQIEPRKTKKSLESLDRLAFYASIQLLLLSNYKEERMNIKLPLLIE